MKPDCTRSILMYQDQNDRLLEYEAEVLPPVKLWVRGEEIVINKIWRLGAEPFIVEIERSKLDFSPF
jgi:hypothetical protein